MSTFKQVICDFSNILILQTFLMNKHEQTYLGSNPRSTIYQLGNLGQNPSSFNAWGFLIGKTGIIIVLFFFLRVNEN